jgi:glycosyltransferase involved in cell wall biosynthesis
VTASRPRVERVLQIHTRYREPGGEERVVDAERDLLASSGIAVHRLTFDNAELREGTSLLGDVQLAAAAVWSRSARRRAQAEIAAFRPQIVHVHNTFAAASPAVYSAAFEARIPVVQSLHNYRMVCPAATVFRDGRACTDCVGRFVPWPAVKHACVRKSRAQSAIATLTLTAHRVRRTYVREVAAFIALTNFQRSVMIDGGLPGERIHVIPNFLEPDPGVADGPRDGFLYVGRLSEEKGISTLVQAAETVPGIIRIAGDGPLAPMVRVAADRGVVEYLGRLDREAVSAQLARAVAAIVPSIWFEGMPMVLLEAFAAGTPVIASRIGSLIELVDDGRSGLHAEPGDANDLVARIRWAVDNQAAIERMGTAARELYQSRYRGSTHIDKLTETYAAVARIGTVDGAVS